MPRCYLDHRGATAAILRAQSRIGICDGRANRRHAPTDAIANSDIWSCNERRATRHTHDFAFRPAKVCSEVGIGDVPLVGGTLAHSQSKRNPKKSKNDSDHSGNALASHFGQGQRGCGETDARSGQGDCRLQCRTRLTASTRCADFYTHS